MALISQPASKSKVLPSPSVPEIPNLISKIAFAMEERGAFNEKVSHPLLIRRSEENESPLDLLVPLAIQEGPKAP